MTRQVRGRGHEGALGGSQRSPPVPLLTAAKRLSAFRRPVRRRKCRQTSRQYGTLTTFEPRSGERTSHGGKVLKIWGPFLLKTDTSREE